MRFGSSIMLSAVDDLFNVLASELTRINKIIIQELKLIIQKTLEIMLQI